MSGKCLVIGSSVCFVVLIIGLFVISAFQPRKFHDEAGSADEPAFSTVQATLSFSSGNQDISCPLKDPQSNDSDVSVDFKSSSLKSFLQATTAVVDRELGLNGLAVFSKLANACQPLVDVSKPKIQVNKIALIKIMNDSTCSLCDLAVNAQNAGYSVVIYFPVLDSMPTSCKVTMSDELLIPLVYAGTCGNRTFMENPVSDFKLVAADRTNVEIRIPQASNYLQTMALYLENLYFWFLLGPIITLEWLRRKKKLCCVTRTQQVDVESATSNEETVRLHSTVEESRVHYMQDTELEENEGELQHLIVTNNAHTDLTTSDNIHSTSVIRRVASILRKVICYVAVGCGWVILILAALPVGISSGGLSFFRFDEEESVHQKNFWECLLPEHNTIEVKSNSNGTVTAISVSRTGTLLSSTLTIWWPAVQIFCFFLYSRFVVKTTWTVSTNFSKLIRSDWFSSNIYLLVLCVVVPYCSYSSTAQKVNYFQSDETVLPFIYFTVYNTVCTVCNFLFVIILNKHTFVTMYVFYISVCMICAYVESDIVAVFYFILNSQGSLINIKLTALRTVAIGLTLTLSFNSSMHIIRKLKKPQESLFEGLSEK